MDVYLRQAGFYGVAKLPFISLDWALITALTERWRLETHTFHMLHGEMTVTLHDVAIQLGLPVDGDAVIVDTSVSNEAIPIDASEEVVQMQTRAYILQLIDGMIFTTKLYRANGIQKLWKWARNEQSLTGKATANFVPQHWQPSSGLVMSNDVAGAGVIGCCKSSRILNSFPSV
ncbi:hypothetical protein MLD38_028811 [Melastoma candidum]|uniref:Uncharacterized protein n=1 Tax=Melastoma candidum TaxID=119954 RepID=A0ACB9N4I8_9MYRT|nr:hypothetical protein MLD38_028811 [Melastoma candidum]